jgi:hypothetical protein
MMGPGKANGHGDHGFDVLSREKRRAAWGDSHQWNLYCLRMGHVLGWKPAELETAVGPSGNVTPFDQSA